LVNPTPYLLDLIPFMCFCPVFHKDAPEKTRDLFKPGKMVGNGAYYLEEWRLNDRIRLRKNKHYWDAANVKLETIDVLPISNASTALNLFLNRDADLMIDKGLIPPNLGEKLRQQPYFHYKQFLGTWFIRFNVSRPPFDNAKVRKAFALAIDRQRIVEKITQYGENVAISMVPPGAGSGYTPPPGLSYDPALAKQTLAEAGYADGKGIGLAGYLFPTLSIEPNIATELQSMWQRNLGVRITLPKQEYKAYLDAQKKVEFDLCRSSWIGDYNDPNTFLDMFTSNSGNNRTNWKNADYDKIILAAGAEVDPAKRYELFRQAEDLLVNQECVVVPVYHYVGVQFYRDEELGGIESNLTDEHPLRCIFRR
jgi:oligopeptide transport system substrate-binding protein